jgi:hypothetical protein
LRATASGVLRVAHSSNTVLSSITRRTTQRLRFEIRAERTRGRTGAHDAHVPHAARQGAIHAARQSAADAAKNLSAYRRAIENAGESRTNQKSTSVHDHPPVSTAAHLRPLLEGRSSETISSIGPKKDASPRT